MVRFNKGRLSRNTKLNWLYNIESCFSGFWSQGDGASFSANYSYKKGCLKAIKEYAPLDTDLHNIVTALVKEQKRYNWALECEINNRNSLYCHSNTMSFNWNMNGSYWIEWKADNDEEHLESLIKELADAYYERLSNEYDYLMTDEAIKEHLICNEYEYLKDGTQY